MIQLFQHSHQPVMAATAAIQNYGFSLPLVVLDHRCSGDDNCTTNKAAANRYHRATLGEKS